MKRCVIEQEIEYPLILSNSECANLFLMLNDHKNTDLYKRWLIQSFDDIYLVEQEFSDYRYIFSFLPKLHERIMKHSPFIKTERIMRGLADGSMEQMKRQFKKWIDSGYFIILQLNKYYLPCAAEFQKLKINHRAIVYGYDDVLGIFQVADTFKNMRYSFEKITYEDFFLSYSTYEEGENKESAELEIASFHQLEYDLNLQKIKDSLVKYLKKNEAFEQCQIFQALIKSFEDDRLLDENSYIVLIEHIKVITKKVELLKEMKILEITSAERESFLNQERNIQQFGKYYRKARIKNRFYNSLVEKDQLIDQIRELHENHITQINLLVEKFDMCQEDYDEKGIRY